MTPQLRVRVWDDGELVEEALIDWDAAQVRAAQDRDHYRDMLAEGRRCRVLLDDPDAPDGLPWMEAREDGIVLVYGRPVTEVPE